MAETFCPYVGLQSNPITFTANGEQMVTMSAGSAIFTFALP